TAIRRLNAVFPAIPGAAEITCSVSTRTRPSLTASFAHVCLQSGHSEDKRRSRLTRKTDVGKTLKRDWRRNQAANNLASRRQRPWETLEGQSQLHSTESEYGAQCG